MKKTLLSISVIVIFGMSSCGGGSKDAMSIETEKLETACECGDAALTIASEMKSLVDAVGEEDPTAEQDELFDNLEDKMDEVEKHCSKEKGFKKKEMKECESFLKAMEIMKNIK